MNYFGALVAIFVILFVNLTSGDNEDQEEKTESTFEKNLTFTEKEENFSHVFQVQLELKTTKVDEPLEDVEDRINKLVQTSFLLANYKHQRENLPDSFSLPNSEYTTKIVKKRVNGDVTYVHFITYSNTGKPILGDVIADDLKQLSAAQMSAELRYPLNRVISNRDIEEESGFRWWFIAGVLGIGVIIFLIGWFILFIYFNTCAATQRDPDDDYLTPAQRAQIPKGIIINPSPPWARGIYDHPLGEPWVDPESSSSATNKKQPKYKRSFRTLSEARLEKRLKEERAAITKAIEEMKQKPEIKSDSSPATSSTDTDTNQESSSKSKTKKRSILPTKIAPISTDTTNNVRTTTLINEKKMRKTNENEQQDETSSESNENGVENENNNENLKKTSGKGMEMVSDYGSSTTDEDLKFKMSSRPMTAGKQRTSCFGNDTGIQSNNALPRVWTPYSAADSVAMNFWNNNVDYPRPSSPSTNGIVEMKSKF